MSRGPGRVMRRIPLVLAAFGSSEIGTLAALVAADTDDTDEMGRLYDGCRLPAVTRSQLESTRRAALALAKRGEVALSHKWMDCARAASPLDFAERRVLVVGPVSVGGVEELPDVQHLQTDELPCFWCKKPTTGRGTKYPDCGEHPRTLPVCILCGGDADMGFGERGICRACCVKDVS